MVLISFKISLALYLLGTLGYILFIILQNKSLARYAYGVLLVGFGFHTLAIALKYYQIGSFPVTTFRESLSFFAWAIIGAYLLIQLRFNIRVLGSFLTPLAAVMMISSSFLPAQPVPGPPLLRSFWLLVHVVTIFLGLAVGSKLSADQFLRPETLGILGLGALAFGFGTASGVLMAKLMNGLSPLNKINPLIGAAGVSAVPMSARVANKVGQEANPHNFLLMHAMGPNVAGVIGSAVAAGVLLALVQ